MMGENCITKETKIGEIVLKKGKKAAHIISIFFCLKSNCCHRTTHELGFAATLLNKKSSLPQLIEELNNLPDQNPE